jgi:hypothetical protein
MATLTDTKEPEAKTCISMEEWIDVWGTVVGKAKRMDDFPMWLQYYPKVLFDIINRSGNCHVRGHRYNYRILDGMVVQVHSLHFITTDLLTSF